MAPAAKHSGSNAGEDIPPAWLRAEADGETRTLYAHGAWLARNANDLENSLEALPVAVFSTPQFTIDMAGVEAFDTYGAWLVQRLQAKRLEISPGAPAHVSNLSSDFELLLNAVGRTHKATAATPPAQTGLIAGIAQVGRTMTGTGQDLVNFSAVLGQVLAAAARLVRAPARIRVAPIVAQLDRVGWQAVPIMMLITFLIGGIIAQQGWFHFRKFGAETYVVDMVGILVLREIGVLIVSIMVAGRSGSSYTAEIGSMKMREEIDALRTMGLDPIEILILPRVLALVVALPILAFLGAIAALFGGGMVCWLYGGMSPDIYITRLHDAISLTHFKVGMIKAPFMALVIGLVAAAEGLRVKGNTESLGRRTTSSVVKAIFAVIVLDGLFAIFFASIGL